MRRIPDVYKKDYREEKEIGAFVAEEVRRGVMQDFYEQRCLIERMVKDLRSRISVARVEKMDLVNRTHRVLSRMYK